MDEAAREGKSWCSGNRAATTQPTTGLEEADHSRSSWSNTHSCLDKTWLCTQANRGLRKAPGSHLTADKNPFNPMPACAKLKFHTSKSFKQLKHAHFCTEILPALQQSTSGLCWEMAPHRPRWVTEGQTEHRAPPACRHSEGWETLTAQMWEADLSEQRTALPKKPLPVFSSQTTGFLRSVANTWHFQGAALFTVGVQQPASPQRCQCHPTPVAMTKDVSRHRQVSPTLGTTKPNRRVRGIHGLGGLRTA